MRRAQRCRVSPGSAAAGALGFAYRVSYEQGDDADHRGYLNRDVLARWLGEPDADVYFCGPRDFMAALNAALTDMGYQEDQLHDEVFGPRTRLQPN